MAESGSGVWGGDGDDHGDIVVMVMVVVTQRRSEHILAPGLRCSHESVKICAGQEMAILSSYLFRQMCTCAFPYLVIVHICILL